MRACQCGGILRQHALTGSREAWTCGACNRYGVIERRAPGVTDDGLIKDLLATFPGIHAKPAQEYGRPEYPHGVWVAGEACMPDGLRIFSDLCCNDSDEYDGREHTGFKAWLEVRGYTLECWDYGVYFAVSAHGR